ncbi:hypothetical protein AB6A40_008875 [Gnathostoma spinigerum]|uniref:E3 ubiquitin-protein ligase n=1 Tax=Gnathostoma spinigerum TaxID=75299 RepID=A0ABD6EXG0_9BILA
MPPGDCFNDRRDSSGQPEADSERKLEDQDWESSVIREAAVYKEYSVALKNAGCPLFGGGDDEKLPVEIRAMAKKLDHRLDEIIGFSGSTTASFRSRTRDELRLFVCQGDTLSAFKDKMKQYDFSLKCNVVWSSDAIAYRCNTCAFNPCMSLCADCFHRADHSGHDYRRFFSHAGGACDCGSPDVLRESGFCSRHGENAKRPPPPPDTIISLAEFIIPKLFIRLFLYFRGWVSFA